MSENNNPDPIIQVRDVSKHFKIYHEPGYTIKKSFLSLFQKNEVQNFTALEKIDFEIEPGEFFGIVGNNGCGKSTLLKLIAGIFAPDSGEIVVRGKIIPFLELGVGFNPELTARENIFLNGVILGMTRKHLQSKFDEIVKFAEIETFLDTPIKNFSSGMRVRLAFSIAIQTDGDIFLLDEVLAVGDAGFQEKCFEKLNDLINAKKTIIFVSHDLSSIERFCTRTMYMERGRIREIGNTEMVIKAYREEIQKQS